MSKGIEGKSVIIQGFGNVGQWASHFFSKDGAKVLGIIEYNSGIYDSNGLDIQDVKRYWL